MLAEAQSHIQHMRPALELENFTRRKLRIYSVSDQDNAGPWLRLNFPKNPLHRLPPRGLN